MANRNTAGKPDEMLYQFGYTPKWCKDSHFPSPSGKSRLQSRFSFPAQTAVAWPKIGDPCLPTGQVLYERSVFNLILTPLIRIILTFSLLLPGILPSATCRAQNKSDTASPTRSGLVGVWQRGSKRVGNGLNQNFRFYPDGSFVLRFDDGGEDLRVIWDLKGRYRLVKDQLYLTIVYRTVTEGGHIEISGSGEDFNNFDLVGGMMKDIREPVIKELPDPLYISVKVPGHIEIGNEDYYKISKKDMQAIEPGFPDSTALSAFDYDSIQTLVARIDREVNGIDADSATRRVVRDTKQNFRGDPTEVTKYFKGDSLCKMVTVFAGRSLPRTTIYYFRKGRRFL